MTAIPFGTSVPPVLFGDYVKTVMAQQARGADPHAMRRRARLTARTILRQVSAGQMGVNMLQSIQATSGAIFEALPGGYVMHCHGVTSTLCRTRAGAAILWAHVAERDYPQ